MNAVAIYRYNKSKIKYIKNGAWVTDKNLNNECKECTIKK